MFKLSFKFSKSKKMIDKKLRLLVLYPWVGAQIGNHIYKVFEKLSLLDRLFFAHPV